MPPDAGSPADWLRHAHSDLALARVSPGGEILLEALCFHAQQAVEKSLKAVLVWAGIPVPKTHSIERLVDMLAPGIPQPPILKEAPSLSSYATTFRYPGEEEPVTADEYHQALQLAGEILLWAEYLTRNK